MRTLTRRHGDAQTRSENYSLPVSASPRLCLRHPAFFIVAVAVAALTINFSVGAQRRSGAHSATPREIFTSADKTAVERAMATACAERIRDPLGSTPIDE